MNGVPRPVPPPSSISEQAQQALTVFHPPQVRPALDDVEGWLRKTEEADRQIVARFADLDFPLVTTEQHIAGVPTYVHRAHDVADSPDTPIYLNLHGGGLTTGSGEACRLMTGAAALVSGTIVWGPDYRMPPGDPYPAALDDCVAVYRAALKLRPPEGIFVGGVSAGGNLAAALVVRARDEGLPVPAALVLQTPEVDLTESGDTFRTLDGVDNVLHSLMQDNLLYANGHDLAHPYLSPLFADLTGFPPTFLQSGTRDLYLSNTVRMHRKLRAAGVDAELHVFEAMPHGGFGGAPEDMDLIREVRRFLDSHRPAVPTSP